MTRQSLKRTVGKGREGRKADFHSVQFSERAEFRDRFL